MVGAHFEPDYPLNNALMFEHELTLRFTIGDPSLDGAGLLARVADGSLEPDAGDHPSHAARGRRPRPTGCSTSDARRRSC